MVSKSCGKKLNTTISVGFEINLEILIRGDLNVWSLSHINK